MGFWDSVKAGFYGAAGVDYYSMKNNEVLRDIRDSALYAPSSDLDAETAMYLGFLSNVAKPVEAAVMVELPKAVAAGAYAQWAAWARPIIERAAATVRATAAPDVLVEPARDQYLDALDCYGKAAESWLGGDRGQGERWAHQGAVAWELAIDELELAFSVV